ncbi:MAG TPA: hypothetical protein VNZ26_05705, partial [Vicinamibacterales bacterium]|nr:hypothetical protein [Vicinamibacterales bacterium]
MNVTMAVFAVNFSFIEYQFSPYRSLMRRVAPWQIAAAGAVLLLALTPLLGFAWSEKWTPTAALLIAPVTACTSLGLVLIARRGTRPEAILARALRSRSLTRFADAFLLSAREARLVPPELRERQADLKSSAKVLDEIEPTTGLAESPGDSVNSATSKKEVRVPPPMHEVAWRLTPRSPIDDPFALIIGVALAALQSSDSRSYELALTAALSALDIVDAKATDSLKSPTGRDLDALGAAATLRQHALHSIRRIGLAAQSADKSGAFTATFLSRCAVFLDARPEEPYRDPYPPHGILDAMAEIAEGVIEGSGSPSALIPLVSARWLGTHGTKLRKDRQTDSGFMFDMVLPG